MPGLADKSRLLNDMLKGESKRSVKSIDWSKEATIAFENLRECLSDETERAQPDFSKPFILTTDASEHAIGGLLSQVQDGGKEKIIQAFSKKLDGAQLNYSVTDKELLAAVKATENFRRYLLGRKFTLRTDHGAIEFIQKAKDQNTRLLRWALKLQEFDYQVEYIKGDINGADGLSRYTNEATVANITEKQYTQDEKKQILQELHMKLGHGSNGAMKFLANGRIKWDGMYKDIDKLIDSCIICLKGGEERHNGKHRVIRTNKQGELWEMDLLGRIPAKNGRSKFIFVAINHHTKWIETRVLNKKGKKEVSKAVQELIIDKHGIPEMIYTDNGREFNNEEVIRVAKDRGIKLVFNSPGHHNAIGAVERAKKTLMDKVRKICEFKKTILELAVAQATEAMNIAPHRALCTSLFVMRWKMAPLFNLSGNETEQKVNMDKIR